MADNNQPLNILLVDDEEVIREALEEYLTTISHHHVETAANGKQALEKCSKSQFDCAFLDLKMPGMDGLELLSRLKEKDQSLPVVVMTGFPSLDVAIGTMRQGASDFLIKPFNLNQVKATLERVVREQRLLKENLHLSERLENQEKIERLNRELKGRIHQQRTVQQISERVDRLQTSEDIYQGMADLACEFMGVQKSAVLLLDNAHDQLLVIAVQGFPPQAVGRTVAAAGMGVCGKVAAEGVPMMGRPGHDLVLDSVLPTASNYLCLPIKIREEVFGVMLVADKRAKTTFKGEDLFLANFLLGKSALSIENIALYESVVTNLHSTLGALVGAMEAKDPYTRRHSRRVTDFSVLTAQTMGLEIDRIESIRFAGYLHDIGKIGIKDNILLKDSPLSDEEFEHIKRHPVIGESIVKDMDLNQRERSIIRHHHERWDGGGYPDGLGGTDIPLSARIVAVADAFDAMTSNRPYRRAKNQQEAVGELLRCSNNQFDAEVVTAFSGYAFAISPHDRAGV